jgi:hypothetical protein
MTYLQSNEERKRHSPRAGSPLPKREPHVHQNPTVGSLAGSGCPYPAPDTDMETILPGSSSRFDGDAHRLEQGHAIDGKLLRIGGQL